MKNLNPNCRVWMYNPSQSGVFGGGKVRLLQAIKKHGSLTKASEEMGISYRKAWSDLKKAESCLQVELVEKKRGGADGGKTLLTVEAKKILKAYERFNKSVNSSLLKAFGKFMKEIK